jgi:predicted phage replisome organizer
VILRLYLKGIMGDGKMSNKKYYWLKLKEDFFDDKVIKYLRKLPDGNALVIIYLKMQLKSLKTEGFLQYDKLLPTYEEELALVLDEDINTVRFAITALIKLGVVERWEDDMLYMASMQQLIGSETAVAERVRRHRALKNKKPELLQCNTELLPSNTAVTNGNTEIERREKRENIEKEIEKEIEKREKKKTMDSKESPSSSSSKQVDEFISLYHDICKSLPKIRVVSDTRKKAIKTLLSKISLEEIKEAFEIIEKTPFLKGDNDRGWKPNIDFLVKHDNIIKILEGFYDSKPQPTNSYHGQRVTINGKEYIMKNGEYFIPKGSGIPVNPYAVDDLPF